MALRDRISAPISRSTRASKNKEDLVTLYKARLLDEINLEEVAELELAQQRARLERVLSRLLSLEGPVMTPRERSWLIKRVIDDAVGLGVLEPLIADETVTEIMVNGIDDVFIERSGRIERVPTKFTSEAEIYRLIDRIVSSVDARLAGGERVNVIIPPLALDGPSITIRRFPQPFQLSDLVNRNSLPSEAADFLEALVAARFSILVSGGTGTGKTTFLNALSGVISDHERIITIEDAAELSLQQPHVVRLEARPPNIEGKGQVTIRDLVKNSLRMRPDRIIVGEVRGGEALDMLQAMNTGHEGSLTTVHANSPIDALSRLETLATMSDVTLPVDTIRDQINGAIDIIVQLERDSQGMRRVNTIEAVVSEHREHYSTTVLLRHVKNDGELGDHFEFRGLPDNVKRRFQRSGIRVETSAS